MAQESESTGGKIQFGSSTNSSNFSNLFGGSKVFNLGAGSSSMSIDTTSVDLSSYFKDDSTNTTRKEVSGGGFDAALSLGIGMGGGSGSGGAVEKITSTNKTDNSALSAGNKSGFLSNPLFVAIGIAIIGIISVIFLRRRR